MQRPSEEEAAGESQFKGKTGITRIWKALSYSMDGLKVAYAYEGAFRLETWLAVPLIVTALFLPVSGVERALLIGSVLLVLLVELLNSAIEAAIDRIGLERHHLSKRAKDAGSAAVLVALVNGAAVWSSVLLDHFK